MHSRNDCNTNTRQLVHADGRVSHGPADTEAAVLRFHNALSAIRTDTDTLKKLIQRLSGPLLSEKQLSRCAHKLQWFLKVGYKLGREIGALDSTLGPVGEIMCFAAVTPHEMTLTDKQFAESWSDAAARKRRKIRIQYGYLTEEGSPGAAATEKKLPRIKKLICQRCNKLFEARRRNVRYCSDCGRPSRGAGRVCALGSRCLRASHQQPYPIPGGRASRYCSRACFDRAQILARKQLLPALDLRDMPSGGRINTGPNEGIVSIQRESGTAGHPGGEMTAESLGGGQ